MSMKKKELVEVLNKYYNDDDEVVVGVNIDEGFVTREIVSNDSLDGGELVLFICMYEIDLSMLKEKEYVNPFTK